MKKLMEILQYKSFIHIEGCQFFNLMLLRQYERWNKLSWFTEWVNKTENTQNRSAANYDIITTHYSEEFSYGMKKKQINELAS